jgi:hypothetical protein
MFLPEGLIETAAMDMQQLRLIVAKLPVFVLLWVFALGLVHFATHLAIAFPT